MKTINKLNDLVPFGIIPLTGEADALCYRLLCDLTRQGAEIVAETFGLKVDAFQPSWNHNETTPHVGSVLLPYETWRDLGVIALVQYGKCHTVFDTDNNTLFGLVQGERLQRPEYDWGKEEPELLTPTLLFHDEEWIRWPESCYGHLRKIYVYEATGLVQTRNTHQMSGRVL